MKRYTWRTAILEVIMIVIAIAYLSPLGVLVAESFRPSDAGPEEGGVSFEHYMQAWEQADLGPAMLSSLLITVTSIAGLVATSSLLGYVIARITRKLSNLFFWSIMIGLILPFQIAMIPLYMTMRSIGLVGSTWGLTLFYIGSLMPLAVFLYVGFIRALPREYEEASWVDGASTIRSFWSIVFPLLRPVTGTVVILNAILVWNDLLTPLLYLSGSGHQTIPVAIQVFVGQFTTNWSLIFAALIIGILPILVVFFVLQRTVIKGFASGLKG